MKPMKIRHFDDIGKLVHEIEDGELCFWEAAEYPGLMYKSPTGKMYGIHMPDFAFDLTNLIDDTKKVNDLLSSIDDGEEEDEN